MPLNLSETFRLNKFNEFFMFNHFNLVGKFMSAVECNTISAVCKAIWCINGVCILSYLGVINILVTK